MSASDASPTSSRSSLLRCSVARICSRAQGGRKIADQTPPRVHRCEPTIRFSETVMSGNTRTSWKVRTTPRAAMRNGGTPVMSHPSRRMRPSVGGRQPVTRLKSVVLPAPFGPITAEIEPCAIENETWLTACSPPNRLEIALTSSSAVMDALSAFRLRANATSARSDRSGRRCPLAQTAGLGAVRLRREARARRGSGGASQETT